MSKTEIDTHRAMHDNGGTFKCKLCSYSAATDSNMQAHVTVHSTYYQEKTREFQRKYATSGDHPPPKVLPATDVAGTSDGAEQFWVTEAKPFLKIHEHHLLTLLTQCKFCPYTADAPEALKAHVVHHRLFSGCQFEFKCEHCDYSSTTSSDLGAHKKLHFAAITRTTTDKMPSPAFFTNYEKLELKCIDLSRAAKGDDDEMKSLYRDDDLEFKEKAARLSAISEDDKIVIKLE